MTQEEKAKAYDEALEKAKKYHEKYWQVDAKDITETLFPQLCESEDERMRRKTINCLTMHNKGYVDVKDIEECIAWLEKQQEQKHPDGCFTCDEYKKGYEAGRRNGFTAGYNKAMKEVEQKEQKPVEIDEYEIIKKHITEDSLSGEVNKRLKECGWCITDEKSAEWSEEDEKILEHISNVIDANYAGADWQRMIDWLKSLRPQPKQEWNEYDNEMFHCICAGLCHLRKLYEKNEDAVSDYNAMIEWFRNRFKSLRLQSKQEWSKEKETIIEGACSALEIYGHTKLASRLKSIRPSWKPSEEQMRALKNSAYGSYQNGDGPLLRELYDDLLKLK